MRATDEVGRIAGGLTLRLNYLNISFYYLLALFGDLCLVSTKVLGQQGVIC